MKEIFLTQGQVAIIDDCDYEKFSQFKWFAIKIRKTFYVARNLSYGKGRRLILMHHEIMGKPSKGFVTDHKNGQGIDNQRSNLRHVTFRQNNQNLKNVKKSSQYPGVYWCKRAERWIAHIQINDKLKHLGSFKIEKEAFFAYKQAVEELGEKVLEGVI